MSGFRVSGFRVLGFRVLGFRVLGFRDPKNCTGMIQGLMVIARGCTWEVLHLWVSWGRFRGPIKIEFSLLYKD